VPSVMPPSPPIWEPKALPSSRHHCHVPSSHQSMYVTLSEEQGSNKKVIVFFFVQHFEYNNKRCQHKLKLVYKRVLTQGQATRCKLHYLNFKMFIKWSFSLQKRLINEYMKWHTHTTWMLNERELILQVLWMCI